MRKSNMSFAVNGNAVVCNILGQDIKARMRTRRNSEKRKEYKKQGIISISPSITAFMKKYPKFFKSKKLINSDGSNFLEGLVPMLSLSNPEEQKERLKTIMTYEYDMPEEELSGVDEFIQDFNGLSKDDQIKGVIEDTVKYKNSIEEIWKNNEMAIMQHIYDILGYEPKDIGKVRTFIMYPNVNIHRMYPQTKNSTFLFFGKKGERNSAKILSYLTHQAVHQPMLPYKSAMTKRKRQEFHGFIKFLSDKETYSFLTGKSYLDIVTENENAEIMGKIYPYWLGYKHRNDIRKGLNPIQEIKKEINRDKAFYECLPANSRKRKMARVKLKFISLARLMDVMMTAGHAEKSFTVALILVVAHITVSSVGRMEII